LIGLPDELLLLIAEFLESETDINSLVRVSVRLYNALCGYLYKNNIKHYRGWALDAVTADVYARSLLPNGNVCDPRLAAEGGWPELFRMLLEWSADVDSMTRGILPSHPSGTG
jgi:hypothetical protein